MHGWFNPATQREICPVALQWWATTVLMVEKKLCHLCTAKYINGFAIERKAMVKIPVWDKLVRSVGVGFAWLAVCIFFKELCFYVVLHRENLQA